ncbi:hypothetical protein [Roseisalinus antarcticus]|uniref:Uncharacterized protein n=1 Tax=Roseisalinus antarcticus TaxID=254357 RepID=A0A1Y5U2Y7_9RHOB|nr:hypothetical protein [Roseisalinus antarcticus]SLN75604.1 hypothetical protein ROA7023_03997 [Roseisalinus antarcticus]
MAAIHAPSAPDALIAGDGVAGVSDSRESRACAANAGASLSRHCLPLRERS